MALLRLCLLLLVTIQLCCTTLADHHRRRPPKIIPDWEEVEYEYYGPRPQQKPSIKSVNLLLKQHTDMVDMVLGMTSEYLKVKGMDRLSIPKLEKTMKLKVLGVTYSPTLRGQNGWIENLSSLSRVGNITATQHSKGKISFSTPLSLKSLTVGFDKYTLPIGKVANLSGKIRIKIGKNKVHLKTFVTINDATGVCSFSLQGLKVDELGGFKADVTGLHPFNWALKYIVDAVLQRGRNLVSTQIEGKFNVEAKKFQVSVPCRLLSLL